jgi:hypothetical protein
MINNVCKHIQESQKGVVRWSAGSSEWSDPHVEALLEQSWNVGVFTEKPCGREELEPFVPPKWSEGLSLSVFKGSSEPHGSSFCNLSTCVDGCDLKWSSLKAIASQSR